MPMLLDAATSREVMMLGLSLILPPIIIVAAVSVLIWALKQRHDRNKTAEQDQKLRELLAMLPPKEKVDETDSRENP